MFAILPLQARNVVQIANEIVEVDVIFRTQGKKPALKFFVLRQLMASSSTPLVVQPSSWKTCFRVIVVSIATLIAIRGFGSD
jgi:hypothetical protein